MKITFTKAIFLICAASLVGCTSLYTVVDRGVAQSNAPVALNQLIAAHDTVVVTTIDGKQLAFQVTAVSASMLEGVADHSTQLLHMEIDQIRRIERREIDGVKTVLLVVAISLGVYAVVQAATAVAVVRVLNVK